LTRGYDGVFAAPSLLGTGVHRLRFRTIREFPAKPYVWLKGRFSIKSRSAYEDGPNRTVRTNGPFVAVVEKITPGDELVKAGLPFLHQPLAAECEFVLKTPARTLAFGGVLADAARVFVDGAAAGWTWGPDWKVPLNSALTARPHRLRIELVPNTFNTFGPHHYYNGDWHVVSPGQIVGEKNFADLPDAPNFTHVPAWHFRPLRLPRMLVVS
jgi:hypothetical protein